MSDYTKATNFTTKDGLSTGDPDKLVKGSDFDTEYNAVAAAIATKYDSDDLASKVEAEAEVSSTKLISPVRLANWSDYNAGMVGDIQALTDPGFDTLLGWDDSASAAIGYTFGDGIETNGTAIQLPAALAGAGLTLTSGVLAVVDGGGLTVNADSVQLTDVAATTTNPIDIASGAIDVDLTALTTYEGNALAAGDLFYFDNGGTPAAVKVEEMGMRVQLAQGTQSLEATDMNSIMEFTATSTLTLDLNALTALPIGVPVILNMKHATQELTVTAAASVTLVTVNHPGGGVAASDTVSAGGTAILYKTAADVWCLAGDISD